jgi:hypothetical protein
MTLTEAKNASQKYLSSHPYSAEDANTVSGRLSTLASMLEQKGRWMGVNYSPEVCADIRKASRVLRGWYRAECILSHY